MINLGKLDDGNKIVLVVFGDEEEGKPREVYEIHAVDERGALDVYAVEYSKAYDNHYYSLWGTSDGILDDRAFYVSSDYFNEERESRRKGYEEYKQSELKEFPYTQEDWDEWLEILIEDEMVYCSKCKDWLPEHAAYQPCDHVRWCDECEDRSTPDDRCECDKEE